MKIVTKKQMRLDELIKYIINNELKTTSGNILEYTSDYENKVFVDYSGQISTYGKFFNDTFTVEVEEKLTEDTVFREVVIVVKNDDGHSTTYTAYDETLKDAVNKRPKIYKVYGLVNDSLHLIWTKDAGIPSEGTLEI